MQKVTQTQTQKQVVFNSFFDFQYNAYSTVEIEFDTEFEENIEIVAGEAAENGRIVHPGNYCTFIQNIIRSGKGHNVIKLNIQDFIPAYGCNPYCPRPAGTDGEIAPLRYVEVNRHYGDITVRRTAYYPDWNDEAAFFRSGDDVLNRVWDFCKYSIKANSVFDMYVDGERERLPYEGDAVINQLGHFCCDASYKTAQNTIEFLLKNPTWPVEWHLLTIRLVYDYFMYSGDESSLKKWLPQLESRLLLDYRNADGLLSADCYGKHPFLRLADIVDYPESERNGYEAGKVNLVPNCHFYGALEMMYALSGDEKYQELAAGLRKSIRKCFLKNGLFTDSENSDHTALHAAMFALRYGLCDEEELQAHREIILANDMGCSVYGSQFLLETCFMCGMEEHALKLLTSDSDRSWLNMMREGATTSMEVWSNRIKINQDWTHAWGASPANIIPRCLCGIRPLKPGFDEFIVDPRPGSLKEFEVKQMSRHGAIELVWRENLKQLTVPAGTAAVYCGRRYADGIHIL